MEYDLSQVMFIATANVLHPIPQPLQDRMEVLRLPGYTEQEKTVIARRFLIPKQTEANGLKPANLEFSEEGLFRSRDPRLHSRSRSAKPGAGNLIDLSRKVARTVVEQGSFAESQ